MSDGFLFEYLAPAKKTDRRFLTKSQRNSIDAGRSAPAAPASERKGSKGFRARLDKVIGFDKEAWDSSMTASM